MNTPYNTLDIANFIIELAIENKKEMPILKLQHILYFINAQFLVEDNAPLIDQNFERWSFGPINLELRNRTREFGSSPIDKTLSIFKTIDDKPYDWEVIDFDNNVIDTETKNRIAKTFGKIIDIPLFKMIDITTNQEIYTKYKTDIIHYEAPQYNNKEIRRQFKKNLADQIWKQD